MVLKDDQLLAVFGGIELVQDVEGRVMVVVVTGCVELVVVAQWSGGGVGNGVTPGAGGAGAGVGGGPA